MNHFMRPALLALIVIVSVSLHGLDRAWSQPADTAAVIEGAKKEGEPVIYGTTDLRQATILNDKFRQKYPFIDVKLNRLSTDNLYPRLIAETRSGKFLSDVVQNNTLVMYFLKRGKFLAHYVSAEDRYYKRFQRPVK
jgi:ABC-type glycerol-3-phosphate transport system substrate-binding protein